MSEKNLTLELKQAAYELCIVQEGLVKHKEELKQLHRELTDKLEELTKVTHDFQWMESRVRSHLEKSISQAVGESIENAQQHIGKELGKSAAAHIYQTTSKLESSAHNAMMSLEQVKLNSWKMSLGTILVAVIVGFGVAYADEHLHLEFHWPAALAPLMQSGQSEQPDAQEY